MAVPTGDATNLCVCSVTRVKCSNCQEMGHFQSKCTKERVDNDADAGGFDNRNGGFDNGAAGDSSDWNTGTAAQGGDWETGPANTVAAGGGSAW